MFVEETTFTQYTGIIGKGVCLLKEIGCIFLSGNLYDSIVDI